MPEAPMPNNEEFPILTVEKFFTAGKASLGLEVLAGRSGLSRVVKEAAFHRPGLALVGFYEHFAFNRIQVVGMSETAYLNSLPATERINCWDRLLKSGVACVIATRSSAIPPEVLLLADRHQVVLLKSSLHSTELISQGAFRIHELTSPRASIHGTFVGIAGVGVLLTGEPGIGKSETALGLIRRGGTLIADDMTRLTVDAHGILIGQAAPQMIGFMEIRGLGLLHIPALYGIAAMRAEMALDLIITLKKFGLKDEAERTGSEMRTWPVLGKNVAHMMIPVAPGRDFVNVVETAAVAYRMRCSGIDAAAILDEMVKSHHMSLE